MVNVADRQFDQSGLPAPTIPVDQPSYLEINVGQMGARPGTDITNIVRDAIAEARNATAISINIPVGQEYAMAIPDIGAFAAGAGKAIRVKGQGQYASTIKPAFSNQPMIAAISWGDAAGNEVLFEDIGIINVANRKYSDPILDLGLVRSCRFNRVRWSGKGAANFTGTGIKLDGSYRDTLEGISIIDGKYFVPLEVRSERVFQDFGIAPQADTISLRDWSVSGCCAFIIRNAANELDDFVMDNLGIGNTNFYPINDPTGQAQVISTLSAPALAGDSTIILNALRNSGTITNVAVTANVATITYTALFGSAPFGPGTTVTIAGLAHAALNGQFVVSGVTNNGFTFAVVTADVASVADAGTVTSSGGGTQTFAVGDAVGIDCGGFYELNKVTSVGGIAGATALGLAQPLMFNHFPNDKYATPCPVVQGGIPVVFGDNIHFTKVIAHLEGFIFGADYGNVHVAYQEGYSECAYFARFTGNVISPIIGPTEMNGVAFRNQVVQRPTYANGTQDCNFLLRGPFAQGGSGFSLTVKVEPTNESGGTSTRSGRWSTSLTQPQESWNIPAASAAGVKRLRVLNDGGTEVQAEYWTGQAKFLDGVASKPLGDIAGKTSAQIDAMFTSQPPADGMMAPALDGANEVFIRRRGGKWSKTGALTLIA